MKDLTKKARAYALKNAIAYNGKASQEPVISSLFNEGLEKKDVGKYAKEIGIIIGEVNKLSLDEQKKEFEKVKDELSERKVREGLPELPDVEKKGVIMRFAPSPSGAFHVGHALTASLSFLYVQKYGGKFYVRIEDTNAENIYPKAYDLIKKDSAWLFDKKAEIVIQSGRMKLYYSYAEKLIKKGFSYVCTCSGDDFREFSKKKKDCPCRESNVKDNQERWEKMLAPQAYTKEVREPIQDPDKSSKKISTMGKKMFDGYKQGEAVLRFKSDMKHKNPAMRDFPLARINETKHPLQKNKYRVWPLMNLAVSVDDIEMKMTHIIRAKDHRDNAERQRMIYSALGKKFPWTGFLGRIHIKGMKLSSTQITKEINDGKYSGWDDSKLPTVAALKKKYNPKAFWKFAERIGLNENDKNIEKKEFFQLLDTFNKED